MILKPECIRDTLLFLEKELPMDGYLMGKKIATNKDLKEYSTEDILYTLIKLKEAGFVEAETQHASNKLVFIRVYSITFNGHQYLEDIKSSRIWEHVKKKADEIGSLSVKTLGMLAREQIDKSIKGE